MRNLIDIVNEAFLVEGRQFLQMFTTVEPIVDGDGTLMSRLDTIKSRIMELRKDDRQVWISRILRIDILETFLKRVDRHPEEKVEAAKKLLDKYLREYEKSAGVSYERDMATYDPLSLLDHMFHLKGIEYQPLQNLVFLGSVGTVLGQARELEEKMRDENERTIRLQKGNTYSDDDEIIIRDGEWVWVKLDRSECSIEAKAMGHCGNSSGSSDERILSLRKIVGEDQEGELLRPQATFILDQHGYLGEMKGKFNQKPAPDTYPMIVRLLLSDTIRGIKGGGYAPENNFDLTDLPEHIAQEVTEKKPELLPATARFERAKGNPEATAAIMLDLGSLIAAKTDNKLLNPRVVGERLVLDYLPDDDIESEIESFRDSSNEMDVHFEITEIELASMLYDLPLSFAAIFYRRANEIADENDDEDFDGSSDSSVVQILQDAGDDLFEALDNACIEATYNATNEGITEDIRYAINSGLASSDIGNIETSDGPTGFMITLHISEVVKLAEDDDEYFDNWGDFSPFSDSVSFSPIETEQKEPSREQYIAALRNVLDDDALPEARPTVDFEGMSDDDARALLDSLYDRIPDGMIRKVDMYEISGARLINTVKGLFYKFYE